MGNLFYVSNVFNEEFVAVHRYKKLINSLSIGNSDRKNSMADISRITKIDLQAVVKLFNTRASASVENKMNI